MTHKRLDTSTQYNVHWPGQETKYDYDRVEADEKPDAGTLWEVWFLSYGRPNDERRGYINTQATSKIIVVPDEDRF